MEAGSRGLSRRRRAGPRTAAYGKDCGLKELPGYQARCCSRLDELSRAVFAELGMKQARRAAELVAEAIRVARARKPRAEIAGSQWQASPQEVPGLAQADQAVALTIQLVPYRSAHMPKVAPQGAFSNGIVTVPPSLRRSQ